MLILIVLDVLDENIIFNKFLKNKSGSERVACILANKLVENLDYEITIINRDANSKEVAYYLNKKIHVERISGSYFQFYKGLSDYINKEQPDKVIVHNMEIVSTVCFLPKVKIGNTRACIFCESTKECSTIKQDFL